MTPRRSSLCPRCFEHHAGARGFPAHRLRLSGHPNKAYQPLWRARERVGDDPELLALVREFLAVGDADAQQREEILCRAAQLGIGEEEE